MKKYTPVFGPQELFDNEFEPNAIAVIFIDRTNKLHATSEAEIDRQLQRTGSYVVAMRRIIKTPVWTVADQQAGRLPEVGSMLNHKTKGECTFIGFGGDDKTYWALKLKNDLIYIADKNWCTPIELPEVKAARLREEWKNNVIEIHHGKRRKMSTSTFLLDDIYDALLSGELQAPKWE